jgi:hypothetical protein
VWRLSIALKSLVLLWLLTALVLPTVTSGQEFKIKKPKPDKSEKLAKAERGKSDKLEKLANALSDREDKIIHATAKQTFGGDTERDRWIKVMSEVYPGSTVPDAHGEIDFTRWFDSVSLGQPVWALQSIRDKPVKELYLRIAQRLNLEKGQPIPREAFLTYAVQNLSAGNSPPWKAPNPEIDPFDAAAKIFNGLDRNKSGALEESELTDSLRSMAPQFDVNRNGLLEYEEYREYFRARMSGYRDNPTSLQAGPPEPRSASKSDAPKADVAPKPESPVPLPKWYHELDEDRDGQVGLYEWRTQRPLGEFTVIDRDGDGLLTPFEIKRLIQSEPQSPYLKSNLPSIPAQFLTRSWR